MCSNYFSASSSSMAFKILASNLRRTLVKFNPAFFNLRPFSTAAAAESSAETAPFEHEDGISMKGVRMSARPLYLDMQATSPDDLWTKRCWGFVYAAKVEDPC